MTGRRALLILMQLHLLLRSCTSVSVITAYDEQEIDPEWADEVDWSQHPCRRSCREDAPPMTCRYIFRVEAYTTMSKACYNCPFNLTDCFRPHCVPGDGVERGILTVNRQMPGPAIEVCQGDRIVVDVMNMLRSESTTMHWHGQNQMKTPYMDGVPHITQCPIPPGASFRYDFLAAQGGTHFWHSHLGVQRGDGLFGPLIVRVPPHKDLYRNSYNYDNFTLVICDWIGETSMDMFVSHHHAAGDNKPRNILVNGLGRFKEFHKGDLTLPSPIEVFSVQQSNSYRMRIINAEFLNCPVEISIDNHTLFVISTDGHDIDGIPAESLVIYAGERFDVIVRTNQPVDNYWIRFRGLMDCDERFTKAHQVAILRYAGAPEEDPRSPVRYERQPNRNLGLQVNALNEGTETKTSLSVPLFKTLSEDCVANTREPDHKFFIAYDFYKLDHPSFHRKGLYGFNQVKYGVQLLTPQLNHISMKFPSFPLMSERDLIKPGDFCNHTTVKGCEKDYCECPHVLQVKLNSVVELILIDEGFAYDANHPFHLHGFEFRVLAMERIGKNVTLEHVQKLDREGKIPRNLHRPPLKDTVTVPDGGYTVLRFHANNPGYWFFHCHIEFHAEIGMSLVFKVGEHEDMLPVPPNFPRCGSWAGPSENIEEEMNSITTEEHGTTEEHDTTLITSGKSRDSSAIEVNHEMESISIGHVVRFLPQFLRLFSYSSSANTVLTPVPSLSLLVIVSLISTFS